MNKIQMTTPEAFDTDFEEMKAEFDKLAQEQATKDEDYAKWLANW